MTDSDGREFSFVDFEDNMSEIGLCLDTSKPISFKLGIMIDMNKVCILIAVLMPLTFTPHHTVPRKLEFMQSF